jgi:hypothetical protein
MRRPIRVGAKSRRGGAALIHADLQASERKVLHALARAEGRRDDRRIAGALIVLGDLAELDGRIGDAFRYWCATLALLGRLQLGDSADALRIRRLLRLWHSSPRMWASYAHADRKRVRSVIAFLGDHGVEVEYDTNFIAGIGIQHQIVSTLARCPKYVVFWSAASRTSPWIEYELEVIRDQRRANLAAGALDNVCLFYCLDDTPVPDEFTDDLFISERTSGPESARALLLRSLKTSAVAG